MTMKLNKKTDYAIRLLIVLGKNGKLDINEVATSQKISTEYLRKVGQELVKLGAVKSKNGKNGGFSLSKDPSDISIYDILLSLEKIDLSKQCLLQCDKCQFNNKCKFDQITIEAQRNFFETYKNISLNDLL